MNQQKTWETIHAGLQRCRQNPANLERCLEHCRWSIGRGNYTRIIWVEILDGSQPGRIDQALDHPIFDDLPANERTFWDNCSPNHPFSCLFARENFQSLPEDLQDKALTVVGDGLICHFPGSQAAYIRMSDLPPGQRQDFEKFLMATARNRPIPDDPEEGLLAWWADYCDFARGSDPGEGLRISHEYIMRLQAAKKEKRKNRSG